MSDMLHEAKAVQRRERSDAAQNRQRLLTLARQLFAEQGVEATSMNEIAQVARLGPGTLYRHFAHKGELCEALLMEDNAAFWERIDTALAHSGEPALNQLGWLIDGGNLAYHWFGRREIALQVPIAAEFHPQRGIRWQPLALGRGVPVPVREWARAGIVDRRGA